MKRVTVLLCIVLSLFLMIGCTPGSAQKDKNNGSDIGKIVDTPKPIGSSGPVASSEPNTSPQPSLRIEDYFPMKGNVRYTYQGYGNEYASYTVSVDYVENNKIQQRIDNGATVVARVLELSDGRLIRRVSRAEAYYRENLTKTTEGEQEILLMEPLVKGTSWKLEDGRVRTITGVGVKVSVPLGEYSAIEVTTEGPNTGKTVDYYAKNVGLIKSVFSPGTEEVASSLSKIEENFTLVQKIKFFYPSIQDDKIYYVEKDVSFKINDITRMVLEKVYKEPSNSKLSQVLTPNTKINSLYLNRDGMVYIDLSGSFISEMNAGAGLEGMILQSVANTVGNYYGASRVILTVDNNLYESGHISLKKGEYIQVNLENTSQLR